MRQVIEPVKSIHMRIQSKAFRDQLCIVFVRGAVVFLSWLCTTAVVLASGDRPRIPDLDNAVAKLKKSENPNDIAMAAVYICQFDWQDNQEALDALVELLLDPSFLRKLDPTDEYRKGIRSFYRLRRILHAIGGMHSPQAEEALFRLINNGEFLSDQYREEAVVEGIGMIRQPSSRVLMFLDSCSGPKEARGVRERAIAGLARIASKTSCAMIEKMILGPDYEVNDKVYWCQAYLLSVRINPEIVRMYRRILCGEIKDDGLRNIVVQTLFDHRPIEWFGLQAGAYPKPPAWQDAPVEVLEEVLVIAHLTSKLQLSKETRAGVDTATRQINRLLAPRKNTGDAGPKQPENRGPAVKPESAPTVPNPEKAPLPRPENGSSKARDGEPGGLPLVVVTVAVALLSLACAAFLIRRKS